MNDMNNERNKSSVILNPERSEWVSRSHVTSVESVVSDGAKTKPHHALRRSLRALAYDSTLKMTRKALSFLRLRGASGAQGISTSASCREAHKRRFLFNSWILRFVCTPLVITIPTLVLIFIIATTTESFAECLATEKNWIDTCYEWNPGVPNNCGDGCTYNYNNGKLTVTATKPDAVVSKGMVSPYYYESGNFPTVSDIEIDGEFEKIGAHAFLYNHNATIHGKDWVLKVNETGANSFDGSNVSGTVIVDDGQTTLGDGPWSRLWTGFNGTLILPPTITSVSDSFLTNLALGENAKIYCGVENCEDLFSNFDCDEAGKTRNASWISECKDHLNDLLDGKLLAYPDGCTKMGATGCTKCKNENFKLNDGECDRLRWTPAEAAQVLRNDNTNSVTITFKK